MSTTKEELIKLHIDRLNILLDKDCGTKEVIKARWVINKLNKLINPPPMDNKKVRSIEDQKKLDELIEQAQELARALIKDGYFTRE